MAMSSPRPASTAMAASSASMTGEATAPPRRSPVVPVHSLSPAVGGGIAMEQVIQASGDVGQEPLDGDVLRSPASKKERLKAASTNSQERSQLAGSKRPLPHASGSLRASKAAKVINAKVEMTQLKEKSKTGERKAAPIKCRSPGINMMARNRSQSHARSSPVAPSGTPKSPSLGDLSPAAPHAVGSIRRPRRLTSVIWNEADPIYIDELLMKGMCKHCKEVFPASKVSGSSQLGRHLKVCDVKLAMDGALEQIRTSDEIDPNWKFDQEAARELLVNLVVSHGLPFTFVEYAGFRKFCESLNPWFKSVSRATIQNDCMDNLVVSHGLPFTFVEYDVLAFPASSVASESAFSICGRVVTDHRSSLSAETVEALMCLEDWMRLT